MSGTGLTKSPTRLIAGSPGRRPVSSVTAATAASIGHKSRLSTGPVEETRKSIVNSDGENKTALNPNPVKRVVGVSLTLSKATGPRNTMSSTNRRSTLGGSKLAERKAPANRSGTSSPTKVAPKSATTPRTTSPTKGVPKAAATPRTTTISSAPRTTRPPPGSTRLPPGATVSEATKKRLVTRPASPAVVKPQLGLFDLDTASHRKPVKLVRPGLVTRTSTMSVTIEQRLREMELVSDMLQAAMAEDGDEDDEVKEEYGKKMDETLASLRVKLEEAKRNEGKSPVSASDTKADSGAPDRISTSLKVEPNLDSNIPDTTLTAVKVEPNPDSRIPDGIPTAVKVEPLSGGSKHEDSEALRSELAASQTRVSHLEAELNVVKTQLLSFGTASQDASEKLQQITEKLCQEHIAELGNVSANHEIELKAVRARLAEVEATEKRVSEQFRRDIEETKRAAFIQGLNSEKRDGIDTASKLQDYAAEVLALHIQLDEGRKRSEDHLQEVEKRFQVIIEKKDEWITSKETEMSSIKDKHAKERISYNRQLKEAKLGPKLRIKDLETKLVASDCRILEMDDAAEVTMTKHHSSLQAKEQEILSLGQVIENLQDQVQDVQQRKEQALDTAKVQMVQEHHNALQKIQIEHGLGLKRSQDEADQRVAELAADHEKEIFRLRKANEEARQDHEVALAELLVSKEELYQGLQTLETDKGFLLVGKQELEKALEDASREVLGLKKVLEFFDKDSQDKDEQHSLAVKRMKDELDSTAKMLDEKSKERASENHNVEMEALRTMHIKEIEALKADSKEKSGSAIKEMQANYDALLETWKSSEKSHQIAMEEIKAQHLKSLTDIQTSHATEIEELKGCLERQLSQIKHEDEAKYAEKTAVVKKQHERDMSDIQQQHEKIYAAVQQDHEKALSELRDQVIQSRKALADVENELQAIREAQSNTHAKEKSENERELEELRVELETARSNTARDKETIDKLAATAEEAKKTVPDCSESDRLEEEMSELTKQHAAEVSRIQETLRTENEKRNMERKHGAEVRDRLANELRELEGVRKELPSVREEAERYKMAAELARLEMHEVDSRLQQALAASQDHEASHRDLSVEVDKLHAELGNLKTKTAGSKGHSKKLSSHSHELEALQIMADKEREYTNKLKKQLDEAIDAADRHATRVREVEAALKVTTAELTEMRTRRANGQEFTTSPAPKGRLRTSRWISESSQENPGTEPDWSGVDLGAHIEGTMAGLQEQIRQIEGVHEDMLDDQKRMVNMLSKVTDRKVDSPLRLPLSGRANR